MDGYELLVQTETWKAIKKAQDAIFEIRLSSR